MTTALEPMVTGVRRAVGEELGALALFLAEAEWPPWNDARFHAAMRELRRIVDEQLDRHGAEIGEIATRLGVDLESLRNMAGDERDVRQWVITLAASPTGRAAGPDVLAECLMVNLFADELAYIGLLARTIGPVERGAAAS